MDVQQFWTNVKTAVADNVVSFCLTLIGGILLLVIGFRLIRWVTNLFRKSRLYGRLDPTAQPFVLSLASVLLKVLLVVVVAAIVGVPTASIITVLGSVGVAIGLALQGSLSNLAGGIMILFYKPFQRGDLVELSGNPIGTVEDISIFYTTLKTMDNRHVVIPNGTVSNNPLTNYSAEPIRRVDVSFSVEYGVDSGKARQLILQGARGCDKILPEPAAVVAMTELADSAVVLQYRGWANAKDAMDAAAEVRELVKATFDANGMNIPFPQMDIHMK